MNPGDDAVPDEMFFDTMGELAASLPDGATPVMPVHCDAKPDLSSVAAAMKNNGLGAVDRRERERPAGY